MGSDIYLIGTDAETGAEVWKSDGTSTGTVRLTDLNPGSENSVIDNFPFITVANNSLFFVANDGVKGKELWKT